MNSVYLSYAVTELFLFVFAASIMRKLNMNMGSEYEVQRLKGIIYAYYVVLVTDAFWALVEGNYIEPSWLLNSAVNGLSLIAVVVGCYLWYEFVNYRLDSARSSKKGIRILSIIPLIITIILDFLSIFTQWVFQIDAQGHYIYGPLFPAQAITSYIYLLIPTIRSLKRAANTRSHFQRSEYLLYASYMAPPLLAGLLEDLVPTVPVLYLTMFMIILILFLTIQDGLIYNDALTGLNNRRRLNEFLQKQLSNASPEHPISVYMIDIDEFKSINDIYGHPEGDHALKIVAQVLREAAAKYAAFAARYGGDEFCLVCANESGSLEPRDFLRQTLLEIQQMQEDKKPYTLSISIGCCICNAPETAVGQLIQRADAKLYEDKAGRKNKLPETRPSLF